MSRIFNNPIYGGQDPFVCKGDDGRYYSVAETSDSKGIALYVSDSLIDRGVESLVYVANENGEGCADLWAPELWHLNGKWYIYYAAAKATGFENWETHRIFVLEAEKPSGPYHFAGKLELGDAMSIDGTVMELPDGRLIFFYMRKVGENNCIYMAPMDSPTHISKEPVLLSKPEYTWEGQINEGPFPIVREGKVGLMYSANAAHLSEYCIAYMICSDSDHILSPHSWKKLEKPIFTSIGDIVGPGHACIVPSPDNREDWLVFHSKFDRDYTLPGGWNRVVNLAKINWQANGVPQFSVEHCYDISMCAPSGEKDLNDGESVTISPYSMYHEFCEYRYFRDYTIKCNNSFLEINSSDALDYGDKILIRNKKYTDFKAKFTFEINSKTGEAVFLFRVTNPATGIMRWNGYGITVNSKGTICLIRSDRSRVLLAKADTNLYDKICFEVEAVQDVITIKHNDKVIISVCDNTYSCGQVGFAAFDSKCDFYDLDINVYNDTLQGGQLYA